VEWIKDKLDSFSNIPPHIFIGFYIIEDRTSLGYIARHYYEKV
jgi:hypothetical protein